MSNIHSTKKTAVLHVALHPVTGPWSVMRMLAKEQERSSLYAGVGIGIVAYNDWPAEYCDDLSLFKPFAYKSVTPKLFGTASFILQKVSRPPIKKWINELANQTDAKRVIVHFHNAWLSGVFVPLQVTGLEVKTVATFHGIAGAAMLGRQPFRCFIHRWIAQQLIQHATVLTSVERGNLPRAEALFHLNPDQFHIIPNGVLACRTRRRSYPLHSGELTIAHVGTLNNGKGWRIISDAVLILYNQGFKVKLLLAGNGPDEKDVAGLAKKYPDCINFYGYMRDPVKTVLPKVDVLVLMTENDGLPMSIIEALSCGIPCISTRIGGIPDAVVDGKSGRLIDRNVSSLVNALRELYENPKLLAELGKGALTVFLQHFDIEVVVKKYDSIYRS